MSHFIPIIQRSKKDAERVAFRNHLDDATNMLGNFLNQAAQANFNHIQPEENVPLIISYISVLNKKLCGLISSSDISMVVIPSEKFGGHVYTFQSEKEEKGFCYIGTCEEVYKALQDSMYTEMRYAQRTRERALNGKNSQFYSEGQKQIAHDFVMASEAAKHEWLSVLNKFVMVCGALEIGLPVGGYQPKDLTPRALQAKLG